MDWNERYRINGFLFGEAPNEFLVSQRAHLRPGQRALAVADGEGRNGVWLAKQGLRVLSVDASPVAIEKAAALARREGVTLETEVADLRHWDFGVARFDVIAAIFTQFASGDERARFHRAMVRGLAPGGILILQGYTPKQLEYGTGGPKALENLYTADTLRRDFADLDILHLREHEREIREGSAHSGMSALVDLVARARQTQQAV